MDYGGRSTRHVLSLIQVFHQKMLETEVKQELLVENYKKSLRTI